MATKSKGIGRGGKRPGAGSGGPRPGAGRKPKAQAVIAAAEAEAKLRKKAASPVLREAIAMTLPGLRDDPDLSLDELEVLAKKALRQILEYSPQDAPRVSAAKLIRDWKREDADRAAEASGMTGKKAQAKAAADEHMANGGMFTPPPPPGSIRRMQ